MCYGGRGREAELQIKAQPLKQAVWVLLLSLVLKVIHRATAM